MRQIRDLLENRERVWVYLNTEEAAKNFMTQAGREGFRWLNGDPVRPKDRGHIIGIRRDLTMGHVSMYIWGMSYQCDRKGTQVPLRVDYALYSSGQEDYICHEPHIRGFIQLSTEY